MKKILLMIACVAMSMTAMAQDVLNFTDQLQVTVNEEGSSQETTVTVEMLEDGYINFILKNFSLVSGEDEMAVGNIEVKNLFLYDNGLYKSFSYDANLKIKAGDKEGVAEEDWIGPLLGNVPLKLNGKLSDDKLFVTIDIDMMESLEQIICVKFGTDFPAANAARSIDYTALRGGYVEVGENKQELTASDNTTTVTFFDNATLSFSLADIMLEADGQSFPFGSTSVENIEFIDHGTYLEFNKVIECSFTGCSVPGAMAEGMTLSTTVSGKVSEDNLYYKLVVDANASLGGYIGVVFGDDFAPVEAVADPIVYNDNIVVTVNENSTDPLPAQVSVTPLNNGGINFALNNFTMSLDGDDMTVGNILVEDIPVYNADGYKYFNYNGNLLITAGDKEGVAEEDWVGPMLGEIPLRLIGRMTDDKLYVNIDIDMVSLEQVILVTFGEPIEAPKTKTLDATSLTGTYNLAGQMVTELMPGYYTYNYQESTITVEGNEAGQVTINLAPDFTLTGLYVEENDNSLIEFDGVAPFLVTEPMAYAVVSEDMICFFTGVAEKMQTATAIKENANVTEVLGEPVELYTMELNYVDAMTSEEGRVVCPVYIGGGFLVNFLGVSTFEVEVDAESLVIGASMKENGSPMMFDMTSEDYGLHFTKEGDDFVYECPAIGYCGLNMSLYITSVTLHKGEWTDAVKAAPSATTTSNAIFNLAGQRLNKAQKGINIINGKKVLK